MLEKLSNVDRPPARPPKLQCTFEIIDEDRARAIVFKSRSDHSTAHRNMDHHLARLSRERLRARDAIKNTIAMPISQAGEHGSKFQNEPNFEAPEMLCPAA